MKTARYVLAWTAAVILAGLLVGCSDGSDSIPSAAPQPQRLPIVFVHGQSGSAQQFETQAMRFTSNGYPQDLLFAFEYDTSQDVNPLGDLDAFLDEVLAVTGASQVYAIGHSRGTTVWTGYLEDPAFDGPARVARYVNIDGRSPEELPGGVPTIGIWGEWNGADSGYNRREDNDNAQIGPDPAANYYFPDKSHTETATSSEAFALMHEFLTGVAAATIDVEAADSGTVQVAGRAVFTFDAEGDNITDLERGELFPFSALTFLTGADVFIPAEADGAGTTEITLIHRGGDETRLNVPNWPSTDNRISVMFRDDK